MAFQRSEMASGYRNISDKIMRTYRLLNCSRGSFWELHQEFVIQNRITILKNQSLYSTYLSKVDLADDLDIDRGLGLYHTLVWPDDVIVRLGSLHFEQDVGLRTLVDNIYLRGCLAFLFVLPEDYSHRRVQCHKLCPILWLWRCRSWVTECRSSFWHLWDYNIIITSIMC
jgi:hypothetical protein